MPTQVFPTCLTNPLDLIPDPEDCHIFYQCDLNPQPMSCGDMMFNSFRQVIKQPDISSCLWHSFLYCPLYDHIPVIINCLTVLKHSNWKLSVPLCDSKYGALAESQTYYSFQIADSLMQKLSRKNVWFLFTSKCKLYKRKVCQLFEISKKNQAWPRNQVYWLSWLGGLMVDWLDWLIYPSILDLTKLQTDIQTHGTFLT